MMETPADEHPETTDGLIERARRARAEAEATGLASSVLRRQIWSAIEAGRSLASEFTEARAVWADRRSRAARPAARP